MVSPVIYDRELVQMLHLLSCGCSGAGVHQLPGEQPGQELGATCAMGPWHLDPVQTQLILFDPVSACSFLGHGTAGRAWTSHCGYCQQSTLLVLTIQGRMGPEP